MQPKPGDIVDGKYELVREIGKGGMGVVYEAIHTRLRQRVALKFLLPADLEDLEALARFEREARASAALTSPHIVRVVDVGKTAQGLPFIVMEYLEGYDLAVRLRQGARVPAGEVVDLVLQACAAMAEAHAAGIVHRDLKPSNLFVTEQTSGRSVVKVMDFGISKITAESDELTTTRTTLGTPQYMAPEQVLSFKAIDHRADIWSLGVVLYRALSGRFPFRGDNGAQMAVAIATSSPDDLHGIEPTLPAGLAAAVMTALAREPSARFQDMASMARALVPYGTGAVSLPRVWAAAPVLPPSAAPSLPRGVVTIEATDSAPHVMTETRTFRTLVTPSHPPPAARRWSAGAVGAAVLAGVTLAMVITLVALVSTRRPHAAAGASASPVTEGSPSTSSAAPLVGASATTTSVATPAPSASSSSTAPRAQGGPTRPAVTPPAAKSGAKGQPVRKPDDQPLHL